MKKALKITIGIIGGLAVLVIVVLIVLRVNSPGELRPLKDGTGSVIDGALAERGSIPVGGIDQGFFIRSENPANPVVLYLHGGPGSPELPLMEAAETSERLEKYFTVCYWDQRGAGMTYSDNTDPVSMSVDRFVEDTREVTEYLVQRFGQQKIYLMGHSWGSYLGVKTIQKYPEYYHAYIGIGQVTHQHLSEQLAYRYMTAHAGQIGDKKALKQLAKFDPDAPGFPTQEYMLLARMKYMNKYGIGITHEPYSMASLLYDVMMFRGYTLGDKAGYAKGSMFSLEHAFYHVIRDNLFETSVSFEVPVYVIHGLYDYQVSHELAAKWVETIEAPHKKLYTFENSAHSPNIEEPERFVGQVKEIARPDGPCIP